MTDIPDPQVPEDGSAPSDATHTDPDNHSPTAASEPAGPDDLAAPLAALVATIRAAIVKGASPETRAAGVTACRAILTVLDAKPGQPLAPPPSAASPAPASSIGALFSQPGVLQKLAAMSRDELIATLKQITGAMPAQPPAPTTAAPRFHLIEIPSVCRPGGSR